MFHHAVIQKFFRRAIIPFMALVLLLQPIGASAATANIYGYHDWQYPTWSRYPNNPRTGTGNLLRFDQWSGNPMHIGYGSCNALSPVSYAYSTVSGWANIGYPSGQFCLFTRPANSGLPWGPSYSFTGVIEW